MPTGSHRKVAYDLRPAKQVERRMLLDAFHLLSEGGFKLREYQYTGFGSFFFVDFVMLHRYFGIDRMCSVEFDSSIRSRCEYNRPFNFVELKFEPISNVLPTLSKECKHILWLDYDDRLNRDIVADISTACSILPLESIILVTVDLEPPEPVSLEEGQGPRYWYNYYYGEASSYFGQGWDVQDFALGALPRRVLDIVRNALNDGFSGRRGTYLAPLFCFDYADGHRMLSVGGMIANSDIERRIDGSKINSAPYIRRSFSEDPYKINVPNLTRRERIYLDSFMPASEEWKPKAFSLKAEDLNSYARIYRYLPNYAELLIY